MQLRDCEGGGASLEPNLQDDASHALPVAIDSSPTRTVPLASSHGSDLTNVAFLLAWVLVLYRDNDDTLQSVGWRHGDTKTSPAAGLDRSLDVSKLPFTKNSSLSEALDIVQQAIAQDSRAFTLGEVLYFNDGVSSGSGAPPKADQSRKHNWTYQIKAEIVEQNKLAVLAKWQPGKLSRRIASTRLDSFVDILNTILEHPERLVSDTTGPTRADSNQIWSWNAELPPTIDRCMHEWVRDHAASQPDVLAIESWDGNFTYAEVEELSTRLALHLVTLGATLGGTIPLCFEKSRWTSVAVLAVMKAGCAFALTDPSQPEARLRTIVEQTGARIIVTSQLQSGLGRRIARQEARTVVLSSQELEQFASNPITNCLPQFSPHLPLYIQFTSGSTGKPKGVVCSHTNYTSGAIPRADAVGYRSHSRVFDFASYAFDVSIDCMLCTLANGGCLCIPSDEERMNDLGGAIRNSRCNMAHMTPSVARVLDSDVIPSLEVLGLGGEAVSAGDASAWSETTKVIIAYGPSECTVGCAINNNVGESTNLGKGVGGLTWIVDPDDHDRLMPVGAVGELLVEGPVVGLGYLKDPVKTAEVFIEDPAWLLAGGGSTPGRHGRLYKTGDLVRYDADGTGAIAFVGRKDQQVKLRGQRIELAEVEYHLRGKLPSTVEIAAEVIKPGGAGEPTLVAFIVEQIASGVSATGEGEAEGDLAKLSSELSRVLEDIDGALGSEIPRYMVPSSYIPLPKMPSLVSGKIDRKRLRALGSSLSREEVARLRVAGGERDDPESEVEKALQRAWTRVLGGDVLVGRNDSFFALGGDSLRAMRLVAGAREEGLGLTVACIFNHPMLKNMALHATAAAEDVSESIPAFSLLGDDWPEESVRTESAKLCGISESTVEDVYPCTPLQEGLMALSAKVKEAYVAQRVVDLVDAATAKKLQAAFDAAATDCPILRTRIIQIPQLGLVQVVVKDGIQWNLGDDLQGYLSRDRNEAMDLGTALARYALITDKGSSKVYFVLTMHHALYDGWSMPLVVDRVNKAFDGQQVQRPSEFKHFIKLLNSSNRQEAETFWREKLRGANGPQFPSLPWRGYQAEADSLLEVRVPLPGRPASNTTVATVIRGAWAYVAARYSAYSDVVFGETLTGRNAALRGADEVEGPMITTVPLRVQVDGDMSVTDYLQDIHNQTVEQIPYEHTGLQHIRRLSPDGYEACELRTGLVLHPSAENDEQQSLDDYPANRLVPAGDAEAAQEALKFNTYPLMLVCSLDADGFLAMASFDSKVIDKPTMERALDHLSRVSRQLCVMTDAPIREIQYMTEDERAELWRLSTVNPESGGKEFPGTSAAWIVDQGENGNLAPLGALGELVVASTSEMSLPTINSPSWLESVDDHMTTRFYKTGKMARMSPDGVVHFNNSRGTAATHNGVADAQAAPVKRISAASAKQRRLRALWSRVLKLPENEIGLNDSFFRLGGDSIAAMKLVSEARLDGLRLSVAQIFQHRSLYDMSGILEDSKAKTASLPVEGQVQGQENQGPKDSGTVPFELVDDKQDDIRTFIEKSIQPKLADPNWKVVDAIPTRPLQDVAIRGTTDMPRFSARYEAIYLADGHVDLDRARLFKACQELVSRNEILRTVFVENEGRNLGVVLEDVRVPVVEYEIDGDVESFTRRLCELDIQTRMPLGSCFVKWFFVQSSSGSSSSVGVSAAAGTSALVFRISHAQYDEICLPLLLRQFEALYDKGNSKPVPNGLPFSSFVRHLVKTSIPQSIPYWQDLLQGSALSVLRPPEDTPITNTEHFAVEREVDISARLRDVTVATIPTAAWALCLARRLGSQDVTFGEVVSGRNVDLSSSSDADADAVIGPCWQYVPVRVKFEPGWTVTDLLEYVQHQHVASSAHEGVGLPEIVERCTDWAAGGAADGDDSGNEEARNKKQKALADWWFDSVVHQDVEHVSHLGFAGTSGRTETIYPHAEPLREWKVQAFPGEGGRRLTVEIVTVKSWEGMARELLGEMEAIVGMLVGEPGRVLFE